VAQLIEQKLGVRFRLTATGELLAKPGLAPQKPLQRAYQRDAEAINKSQRERYTNPES
jgi:transposase